MVLREVHTYEWMKSILCGRTQQVYVQNTFPSRGWVTVGVPQGSILGPLLFSIYVNDLPNSVNTCDINMYADDTELHYCCSHLQEVERVIQNELERVSNWMVVNRLKLNVNKSMCMLIGSQQRVGGKTLCLSLNGSLLKQVSSTKYLGVCTDHYLTWQNHIDYVLKTVRGRFILLIALILLLQSGSCYIKYISCRFLTIVMSCGHPLMQIRLGV